MSNKISKKQVSEVVSKLKSAISHPSVSALIYGYLKEKDLNFKSMSVDQWKEIEKDLVEIILSEIFPGEEIAEDQLTFTALANSIAFMSNFISKLNQTIDSSDSTLSSDVKSEKTTSKFEV